MTISLTEECYRGSQLYYVGSFMPKFTIGDDAIEAVTVALLQPPANHVYKIRSIMVINHAGEAVSPTMRIDDVQGDSWKYLVSTSLTDDNLVDAMIRDKAGTLTDRDGYPEDINLRHEDTLNLTMGFKIAAINVAIRLSIDVYRTEYNEMVTPE